MNPRDFPMLTCRICGARHYSPVCCPICKEATPHYVVLKGSASQPQPNGETHAGTANR